jgi:hypothetical protein
MSCYDKRGVTTLDSELHQWSRGESYSTTRVVALGVATMGVAAMTRVAALGVATMTIFAALGVVAMTRVATTMLEQGL